jgi:hypothetical protein
MAKAATCNYLFLTSFTKIAKCYIMIKYRETAEVVARDGQSKMDNPEILAI